MSQWTKEDYLVDVSSLVYKSTNYTGAGDFTIFVEGYMPFTTIVHIVFFVKFEQYYFVLDNKSGEKMLCCILMITRQNMVYIQRSHSFPSKIYYYSNSTHVEHRTPFIR